jgi:hemerythrin superfamily protein
MYTISECAVHIASIDGSPTYLAKEALTAAHIVGSPKLDTETKRTTGRHMAENGTTEVDGPGEHLVQELLWIHGILRHDLKLLSRIAIDVADGKDPESVRIEISRLQSKSPLWQLKVNCIYYCRLVHAHHGGEDAHLFPALRRSNPALEPVVDRLEADHRKVSDILDDVELASYELTKENAPSARSNLVEALNRLSEHLLEHLSFEEESISPTLRSWGSWPFF